MNGPFRFLGGRGLRRRRPGRFRYFRACQFHNIGVPLTRTFNSGRLRSLDDAL
jgi:hypothetical protein